MREVFNIVIYNWCTICPEWVVSTRKSNGWCLKLHWTSSYNQMCSLRFNTKHINKTSNIYYMTVPYIAWFHTPESSFRNTLSIKKNFNEIACIVSKIQDYIRTYSKTRLCIMFLSNASKSKKIESLDDKNLETVDSYLSEDSTLTISNEFELYSK